MVYSEARSPPGPRPPQHLAPKEDSELVARTNKAIAHPPRRHAPAADTEGNLGEEGKGMNSSSLK